MKKLALLAVLGLATAAFADQLVYDNGLDWSNGLSNFQGSLSGTPYDRELADDFNLSSSVPIVHVQFMGIWYAGTTNTPTGIHIRVYPVQSGNTPSTTPIYDATNGTVTSVPTGNVFFGRPELKIDITGLNFNATAGTNYFISMQPMNTTDNFFQGTAPKNAFSGVWLSYPDLGAPKWTYGTAVFGTDYGANFKLFTPEPASLALLALSLLLRRR